MFAAAVVGQDNRPATPAEMVELQKVVAPFRGVHTSHMRDEGSGVVDSVKEAIPIGEQGGVPTHVSHHKMIGKANWGRSVVIWSPKNVHHEV